MARDHFSANTIKSCLHILDTLFDKAVRKRPIVSNPITKALKRELRPYLKASSTDVKAFTHEEAQAFLEAAKDRRLYRFYLVGFLTGARIAELEALRCDDIQKKGTGGGSFASSASWRWSSPPRNPRHRRCRTGRSAVPGRRAGGHCR